VQAANFEAGAPPGKASDCIGRGKWLHPDFVAKETSMRAEITALEEKIKQSIALLRRRL